MTVNWMLNSSFKMMRPLNIFQTLLGIYIMSLTNLITSSSLSPFHSTPPFSSVSQSVCVSPTSSFLAPSTANPSQLPSVSTSALQSVKPTVSHTFTTRSSPAASYSNSLVPKRTQTPHSQLPRSRQCIFPERSFFGNLFPQRRGHQSRFSSGLSAFHFRYYTGTSNFFLRFNVYQQKRFRSIFIRLNRDRFPTSNPLTRFVRLNPQVKQKRFKIPYKHVRFLKSTIQDTCCDKYISVYVSIRICNPSKRDWPKCELFRRELDAIPILC